MWSVRIFRTRTGAPELVIPVSAGRWETRLSGRGRGQHTTPLEGANIPQTLLREVARGNKYTVCQMWGDHIAYAGVIQRRRYVKATGALILDSSELRLAYMNSRQLYGVPFYDPNATLLTVTSKSHSGALLAVNTLAQPNDQWLLPLDDAADGSGSFSAVWRHDERMKWEDLQAQIEADGSEINYRPYVNSDGWLRFETRVDTVITSGTATDIAASAPGSRVTDLEVVEDYTGELSGVLVFGKGGPTAPTAWAGAYSEDISGRDTYINLPDLDAGRLQAAADTAYASGKLPTEQWSFGLHVWPDGPEFTAPGRLLSLWTYGDRFIPDGAHEKRVVALSGDMGFKVTPEVQDA